jgi:hypothetical protein
VILKTIDGGINWGRQTCPTVQNLVSAFFISPMTGWVVGNYGTILKTTDGGGITSMEYNGNSELSLDYYLSQNYPNPFNPKTNFEFQISNFGFVSLKVYDILGSEVATLVNEVKQPGTYKIEFNAGQLSSGIYFYRIQAGSFSQIKKMILLK